MNAIGFIGETDTCPFVRTAQGLSGREAAGGCSGQVAMNGNVMDAVILTCRNQLSDRGDGFFLDIHSWTLAISV